MVGHSLLGRIIVLVFALAAATVTSAEVTVRVDRNPVSVNESFRLTYEADFQFRHRPDLAPLSNQLDILGTSSSTKIVNINGRQELAQSLILDVMAKDEGMLTIPSVDFDGQRTDELTINVLPAAAGTNVAGTTASDFFFEVTVDPEAPYVQSQLVYTMRLFYAIDVSNASLSKPTISSGDAIIEQLGEDAHFRTQRNGRDYTVVERRYAVFPQASGSLRIEPLRFDAQKGGRASMFDSFAQRGQPVRLNSEAVEIEVLPIPGDYTGKEWLPARRVYLQEDWSGAIADLPVGEPVTRTVQLVADGLRASQLPEVSPTAPQGLKQYPDHPVLEDRPGPTGVTGIRQEKIALIPSAPGDYEIPEIALPWFNTQTGEVEYARLPSRTITVTGALAAPVAPTTAETDVAGNIDVVDATVPASPSPVGSIWKWLSLGLSVAWLLTIVAWLLSRRRRGDDELTQKRAKVRPLTHKEVSAELKAACLSGSKDATRNALLKWSAVRWPGNPATSLGEIASRLSGELQTEIHGLNRALYEQGDSEWSGDPLWSAFIVQKVSRSKRAEESTPRLAPLHRL